MLTNIVLINPRIKIQCEKKRLATLSVARNTNSKYLFSFLYISLFWDAQILWRTKKLLASCYILRRRYFFVNVCKRHPIGKTRLFLFIDFLTLFYMGFEMTLLHGGGAIMARIQFWLNSIVEWTQMTRNLLSYKNSSLFLSIHTKKSPLSSVVLNLWPC